VLGGGMIVGVMTPLIPYWVFAYGLTDVEVGTLNSWQGAAYALSTYAFGGLSDKIGCRRVICMTMTLLTITLAFTSFESTYQELFVGWVLIGGLTATLPVCMSLAVQLAGSEQQDYIVGAINSAGLVGFLLGPILTAVAFASNKSAPASPVLIFLAITSAIVTLICSVMLQDAPAKPVIATCASISKKSMIPVILPLAFVRLAGYALPFAIVFTVLPDIWLHVFNLGPRNFALTAAGIAWLIVPANLVAPRVAEKIGDANLIIFAMVLETAHWAFLALPVTNYISFLMSLAILLPIYWAVATSTTTSMLSKLVPVSQLGEANGIMQALQGVFSAALPAIASLLYSKNQSLVFIVSGCTSLLSAIFFLYFPIQPLQVQDNESPLIAVA